MGKLLEGLTFRELDIEDYERVVEVQDENSGLHAIIAIQNTKLGPALGGIRAYPYASFDDALNDVLRLSRGMTYKSAISQTGTGGGKSVIIFDNKLPKPEKLLKAFAEAVNYFEGTYICAEDVGMPISDLEVIGRYTRYAVGLPHPLSSGDPSRFTAFGGFRGIQAVCQKLWKTDSPSNRTVAIQGLGSVGMKLADSLFWHGAKLIVADLDSSLVEKAVKNYGAKAVSTREILTAECDILAPCALGGILNPHTIPHLRCKGVAGLANNQLLTTEDGDALHKRGILYAPDFVINSGGLLNVCVEVEKQGYSPSLARSRIEKVYDVLLDIFNFAEKRGFPTYRIADEIAEHNLKKEIGKRNKKLYFHH